MNDWAARQLQGTAPPPPPVDVEIPNLEEAAKGAKGEPTMRELLEAYCQLTGRTFSEDYIRAFPAFGFGPPKRKHR